MLFRESTRGQASTPLWFEHRIGRITASVFGRVAKCRETTFPSSLVKTIMQYSGSNRDVPAIIEHKKHVRRMLTLWQLSMQLSRSIYSWTSSVH